MKKKWRIICCDRGVFWRRRYGFWVIPPDGRVDGGGFWFSIERAMNWIAKQEAEKTP